MPDQLLSALLPLADWHGPGWWIIFVPFIWFGVILLFFFVFRRSGWGPGCGWGTAAGTRYGRGRSGFADPVDILDRRFAEGEIDAEEFKARRSTLERRRPENDQ